MASMVRTLQNPPQKPKLQEPENKLNSLVSVSFNESTIKTQGMEPHRMESLTVQADEASSPAAHVHLLVPNIPLSFTVKEASRDSWSPGSRWWRTRIQRRNPESRHPWRRKRLEMGRIKNDTEHEKPAIRKRNLIEFQMELETAAAVPRTIEAWFETSMPMPGTPNLVISRLSPGPQPPCQDPSRPYF